MVGVAPDTGGAGRPVPWKSGMQAMIALQFRRNFLVALRAAKGGRMRIELVALGALRFTAKALMRPGQRPGRDLRLAYMRQESNAKERVKDARQFTGDATEWDIAYQTRISAIF